MTPHRLTGNGIGSAVGLSVLAFLMALPGVEAVQSPPPITGTIALEGTTEEVYTGANTVIVKTIDGLEHIFRFTRDLLVHGGKGEGVNALVGLREGTTVVVHYTVADGATETFRMANVVTEDAGRSIDASQRVVVYYSEEGRDKVAHYFKKVS